MPKKDVGYLIKSINDKLKVKADEELKSYNLTFAQSRVFAYLQEKGGKATQKEIEIFLDVSHPTVVGIVSRMEQNGYVNCFKDEDNRNKIVRLTAKADSVGMNLEQSMRNTEKMLLAPLTTEEAEKLKQMLLLICNNLD